MLAYLFRRLLWTVPTFLGITLLVFAAARALPGNAATIAAGGPESRASTAEIEARSERYRAEYLLDQPLWKQYLHFLGPFDLSTEGHRSFGGSGARPWHGLLAFDFGREYGRPTVEVGGEILRRLAVTVPLALAANLLSFPIVIRQLGDNEKLLRAVEKQMAAKAGAVLEKTAPPSGPAV